jgi:hypothetical protein
MGIPRQITHPRMGTNNLVGSPINMSDTPPGLFARRRYSRTDRGNLGKLGYGKETIKVRDNKVI